MKKRKMFCRIVVSLTLSVVAGVAWGDDTMTRARVLFKVLPSKVPVLKGNAMSAAKYDLGKKLYFDPRLSASHLISCNTCHNLGLNGIDLQETSIGHRWQKGPRNAPTVFNSVFNVAQFWDGRAEDLKAQAKGPVQASVEMNNSPERTVATLKSIPGYVKLFQQAFPRQNDPVTFDNMAKAIEIFEATLVTPDAPFDRYLKGDGKAIGAREVKGLSLFMVKGCGGCHGGLNAGGSGYFPFGVVEAPSSEIRPVEDTGRFKVTNTAADNYVFRSPSLRNVAVTGPYFHSGKVWRLRDAVVIMGSSQLGIKINQAEADDITAFLSTMTGRPPKVEYPILPPSSDDTPKPVIE